MAQGAAQKKTNSAIAARYAEEERRRKEGKEADASLAAEVEAKRQARMDANKDEVDGLRDFTNIAGADGDELRQGLQIETEGAAKEDA